MFPDVKDRAFLLHLHKLAKKNNYDIEHYNTLMKKLSNAQNDLQKIRKPIGLSLPESELRSLLHKGGDDNTKWIPLNTQHRRI